MNPLKHDKNKQINIGTNYYGEHHSLIKSINKIFKS